MLGFVKFDQLSRRKNFDIHQEQKRKNRIFAIVFTLLGFGLLNLILYLMTRV